MKRNIILGFIVFTICITNGMADVMYQVTNIRSNDTLSVRSGAGTHNKKIDELAHNTQNIVVEVCEDISEENEWCKIDYGRGIGWVSAKYLSVKEEIFKSYYKTGKLKSISSTDGAFSKTTAYYESGQISVVLHEAEGYLDGSYKIFYPSGVLMYEALMESGDVKGVEKIYFESGALQMSIHYGEESVQPLFAHIYKKDGTEKKVTEKDQLKMLASWIYEKTSKFLVEFIY